MRTAGSRPQTEELIMAQYDITHLITDGITAEELVAQHPRIIYRWDELTAQSVAALTAAERYVASRQAAPEPERLAAGWYRRGQRQQDMVGDMLGRVTTASAGCHYCGLPLDRSGRCQECV